MSYQVIRYRPEFRNQVLRLQKHLWGPWTAAFVIQSLIAFGVSVPSAPGFFGVFEAVTKATLILYGIAPDLAVSYAVGYHLFTFVPITVLGLWSLSRTHLHLADLRAEQAKG